MENEQIKRIAKRIYENSKGAVRNYVMFEGLIRRFIQLNPDIDPEVIDWAGVWDDMLAYDELIQAFGEQYPMYRWDDKTATEEAYNGDRVKSVVEELSTKLDIEDFDRLTQELQKLRDEVLEDVRRTEAETPQPKPEPKAVEVEAPRPKTPPPAVEVKPPAVKPTITLLAKYPFLSTALPLLRAYTLNTAPQEVRKRAAERVLEALERGERGVIPKLDNPWVELLSFPYARALVNSVNDDWLRRRWALAEAARAERLLHSEGDDVLRYFIDDLKLQATKSADGKYWVMHFTEYLKLAKRLTSEPRFKLANRLMDKGLVSLTRPEVIRLVREKLYNDYSVEKPVSGWEPEEAKIIREALQKRAAETLPPAPSREWAPCMVALRNKVADASHFGLFALAAYMAQRGYSVDSIIESLKVRADFDERVARYQVEHIAGLRGSRVKYKPPSCSSMKTHNLCIDDGRRCPYGIKNPLQYTGSAEPK